MKPDAECACWTEPGLLPRPVQRLLSNQSSAQRHDCFRNCFNRLNRSVIPGFSPSAVLRPLFSLAASPASSTTGSVDGPDGLCMSCGSITVERVRARGSGLDRKASLSAATGVVRSADSDLRSWTDCRASPDPARAASCSWRLRSASSRDIVISSINLINRSP